MSNAISTTLEKLLFDYETVILPGLGGFTTNKTSATVDYAHGTLQPPSKSIAFNENLTVNDGLLVQRLCRDYSMNADDAQAEIEKYVESTRSALEQREIITLPGVGRLYKNYAQKVQFLPDQSNFNSESYGLPPLQFSPIMRSREVKEAAVTGQAVAETAIQPQPSTESPKPQVAEQAAPIEPNWQPEEAPERGFWQRALPFLVAIFAMAGAAGIFYYQKSTKTAGREIVVNEQTEPAPKQPIAALPGLPGSPIVPAPEPKKNVAPPAEADDEEKTSDDDSDAVLENERKKAEALSQKTEKDRKTTEKKAEKVEPKAAPKVENKDSEKAQTAPPASGDGRRAVIVVGTYRDKSNANRILDILKKNGWDTYFRNDKGWQVGIETTYKDFSELKKHLSALEKQTGETNIWIKKK